ncbi:HalOD1 output domain-containing protein [Halorhabdus amylolytica]|uniref:HalOD1 output domain-containing protein n=1 Tax=Halorhabdus amylolytica TaxID=2559573 RepID=UPI0010AB1ABE|nr:HalOD1 output domain-containing protein [Halorhabdus amylolytica]
MCPEDLYVIPDEAEEGGTGEVWIQPRSVDEIVIDAILEATEYDAADLDPLGEYVDYDSLGSLFDDADLETLSFEVDTYEVTVHQSGAVDVVDAK